MTRFIRFRWWPIRRLLILPIVSTRVSAGIAIFSFLVGIAGLSVSVGSFIIRFTGLSASDLAVVGWVLASMGFLGAAIYFTDDFVRKFTIQRTGFEKDARIVDFANAPTTLQSEYRFVRPRRSREELYPYVDLSTDSDYIQASNDLTPKQRSELYDRWISICPHGFLHLEKRVDSCWRPIAVSIVLPLSLAGFAKITNPNEKERTKVIDLGIGDLRDTLDRRHPVLLIDTWIVDRHYRSNGHGKQPGVAGGWANALVLRHIAEFWNAKEQTAIDRLRQLITAKGPAPEKTFLVETSNQYLIAVLRALAFRSLGKSKIDIDFYFATESTSKGVAPVEFGRVLAVIASVSRLSIHNGTAPKPPGWYKFS